VTSSVRAAGDPYGEVRDAWHATEVVVSIYDIDDADLADEFVCELAIDLQHEDRSLEVRSLGRALAPLVRPRSPTGPRLFACRGGP
jgi:hypothetical protein